MRTRLVAAGLVAAAFILTAVAAQAQDRTQRTIYEQTFDVSSGARLLVEVGDMDVRVVTGGSAGHVEVIARARDHGFAQEVFDRMRFSASTSGRALRIATDEPDDWPWDWQEWQRRGGAGFEAIITVPTSFDLDLHTGDGDVTVESVEGSVEIVTGDGDVSLEGASGSDITLRTGDGDITARRLDASTITLRTGDGDVMIDEVSGAVDASTGDGDVSLGIGRYEGLSVRTGDGDVTVSADPSIRATLDIRGEDLELGRSFTLTVSGRVNERSLRGTLNGGGPELRVRTGDGSISLIAR